MPVEVPPVLALPNEHHGEEKNNDADSPDGVEHVRDANSVDPRHQRENEDRTEQVSSESQADKCVANNLPHMSVLLPRCDQHRLVRTSLYESVRYVKAMAEIGA